MSNTAIAFIYMPFAVITAVILLVELARRLKRREDYFFIWACICIASWFASNIAAIFTDDPIVLNTLIQIGLIFVAFLPPCMLLFFFRFYRSASKPSAIRIAMLMALPSVNAVVVLTGNWHHLMVDSLDIVSLSPFRDFRINWGPWFWVHTAFCYVMTITLLGFILISHFRKKRFYRLPSTLMVTGIVITLFGNVLTLTRIVPANIDPTLITASLSLILFNLAITNNNNSKFVRFSRGQIIHYMDEFIFVLNEKSVIVDYNRPAAQWCAAQGIPLAGTSMDAVKKVLAQQGTPVGDDCYMLLTPHPLVLSMKEHILRDENDDVMGFIVVFSDVTQTHMLMERLEAKAKMDSLTGIPNRAAYNGALNRMDAPGYFPLAVVMGDLNGLKYVNDNFGHQYGDMMLQRAAEIMERHCPDGCFIGRIGGDEFVYLLPGTQGEDALRIMKNVKEEMALQSDLPFPMSIALGSAVKHNGGERIDEVIALADGRMYEDKKRMSVSQRNLH